MNGKGLLAHLSSGLRPASGGLSLSPFYLRAVLGYTLLWSPVSMAADQVQTIQSIRAQAEQFVTSALGQNADVTVDIGQLDARLRLAKCNKALTADWANSDRQHGRVSIAVACQGAKPWKIFVAANVHVFKEVAVIATPKLRGEALNAGDIRYERQDVTVLGDRYLTDASALEGYVMRRTVNEGTVLTPRMLKIPKMVKRGQTVTLFTDVGGIQVRMAGEALSDGAQGSVIKVKNLSSSRIVEGEVVDKGTVKVRF